MKNKQRLYKRQIVINGQKRDVIAYRKGKTSYIRDSRDASIIARSRNKNSSQLLRSLQSERVISSKRKAFNPMGEDIYRDVRFKKRVVEPTFISREKLTNVSMITQGKYRSARKGRDGIKRRIVGQTWISVTFVKRRPYFQKTCMGTCSELKYLGSASEREKSFDIAFSGALSQIDFSYDYAIINYVNYVYFDKND